MTWFGDAGHIDVGYDSTDPDVAAGQIVAAQRRGISGFMVDWYADVSPHVDEGFAVMLAAAGKNSGESAAVDRLVGDRVGGMMPRWASSAQPSCEAR